MRKSLIVASGIFLACFSLAVYSVRAEHALCSLNDGRPADGKIVLEKQGKKYQFCCSGCLQQFKNEPDKFAAEIQSSVPNKQDSAEAACSTVCSD